MFRGCSKQINMKCEACSGGSEVRTVFLKHESDLRCERTARYNNLKCDARHAISSNPTESPASCRVDQCEAGTSTCPPCTHQWPSSVPIHCSASPNACATTVCHNFVPLDVLHLMCHLAENRKEVGGACFCELGLNVRALAWGRTGSLDPTPVGLWGRWPTTHNNSLMTSWPPWMRPWVT